MSDIRWTVKSIPDLKDKVVIVTGGNSGIGFETVKELSRKNAIVILACRNIEKGTIAKKVIKSEIPNAQLELIELDLSKLKSIKNFVETFKVKYKRLDILINNAGVMWMPYKKTEEGFESHFGINHLGHFALTNLLLEIILKTPTSRIVTVSSIAHSSGEIDFDNLLFERSLDYNPNKAYSRSKLANLLFTFELQNQLNTIGSDVISVGAHPGGASTNLGRYVENKWWWNILLFLTKPITQSASMGALPILRAATDPNVKACDYYGPGGFLKMKGFPVKVKTSKKAKDKDVARKLWELSEKLTSI